MTTPLDFSKPAVVLVHGIFDTNRNMAWLARQFTAAGYETFCPTLSPANGTRPLAELSAQLDKKVRAHFPPERRLHVIGFSMGGVITRHWLQNGADRSRVVSFATISAPHHGSGWAWIWPLPGLRDLRSGSAFQRDLEAHDDLLLPLHPLSLRTALDLMILPNTSSIWPVATNETFWLPAHPLMTHSPSVARRLLVYVKSRE